MSVVEDHQQGAAQSGRHCPGCGARVSERAKDCFACGADLTARPRRRIRLPYLEIILVAVIAIIAVAWWGKAENDAWAAMTPSVTPTSTATPSPTSTTTPTASATHSPTPTLTPTPIVHTVQSGESPLYIAGLYGVTLKSLLEANSLQKDDLIRVNQEIRIPTLTPVLGPDGKPATPPATPTPDFRAVSYSVQRGDTLALIAAQFGVPVEAVYTANSLRPDAVLRIGQALIIPQGAPIGSPTPGSPATLTPTPGPQWPAPVLLSPADATPLSSSQPILLRWSAVGMLEDSQLYALSFWIRNDPDDSLEAIRSRQTSSMLPSEWVRSLHVGSDICWQVQVVEQIAGSTDPEEQWTAASLPSQTRCFRLD